MLKSLLRFTIIGSVDDGKSTLIGRLLYDNNLIKSDQLKALKKVSLKKGNKDIDFSLLTDGLKFEEEQGITIDVAYRYFETKKRKYIITDTPGHVQFTCNMITGASNAMLALIILDINKGITEQTIRHAYIASILKIKHIILCINKMDLVGFREKVFNSTANTFLKLTSKLSFTNISIIPISALFGDNIVSKSKKIPWYKGPTVMSTLENINTLSNINLNNFRFPVQRIINYRKKNGRIYRGISGMIYSGIIKKGDDVIILPSGLKSKVKSIRINDSQTNLAFAPSSISIEIEDDIEVERGSMIVKHNNLPIVSRDIDISIFWMDKNSLKVGDKLILKHSTLETYCVIRELHYKFDMNSMEKITNIDKIEFNDIGSIKINTASPIMYDLFSNNNRTGCLILIDPLTNNTIAAGIVI